MGIEQNSMCSSSEPAVQFHAHGNHRFLSSLEELLPSYYSVMPQGPCYGSHYHQGRSAAQTD